MRANVKALQTIVRIATRYRDLGDFASTSAAIKFAAFYGNRIKATDQELNLAWMPFLLY